MMKGWFVITCRQAHALLSRRADGALPLMDRLRLRLHLTVCDWCTRVSRQFQFISDAVRRLGR